mmetsp:Transcript_31183/g.78518  ORF Transcript_31183/g.78518 Transcript_31183/m.78518 type:complete len:365 (+) Transcript_31183:1028-2122(+)
MLRVHQFRGLRPQLAERPANPLGMQPVEGQRGSLPRELERQASGLLGPDCDLSRPERERRGAGGSRVGGQTHDVPGESLRGQPPEAPGRRAPGAGGASRRLLRPHGRRSWEVPRRVAEEFPPAHCRRPAVRRHRGAAHARWRCGLVQPPALAAQIVDHGTQGEGYARPNLALQRVCLCTVQCRLRWRRDELALAANRGSEGRGSSVDGCPRRLGHPEERRGGCLCDTGFLDWSFLADAEGCLLVKGQVLPALLPAHGRRRADRHSAARDPQARGVVDRQAGLQRDVETQQKEQGAGQLGGPREKLHQAGGVDVSARRLCDFQELGVVERQLGKENLGRRQEWIVLQAHKRQWRPSCGGLHEPVG